MLTVIDQVLRIRSDIPDLISLLGSLAGRETDWEQRLAAVGIRLAENDSLFDLTVQLQQAIETHLRARGGPTDTSEMAQQAAGEAISELAAPNAQTLFGSGRNELLDALRKLSTKKGFARLGQLFFARFMSRFLNFYLSRMTAASVGSMGFIFARAHEPGEVESALRSAHKRLRFEIAPERP